MSGNAWLQRSMVCVACVAFFAYVVAKYDFERAILYFAAMAVIVLNGCVLAVLAWDRRALFSYKSLALFAAWIIGNAYVFIGTGEHKYVVVLLLLPALIGAAVPYLIRGKGRDR